MFHASLSVLYWQMMEHFFKKLLQNPTAKADDETVITLGLTLMLTSATSSSSSFILRVILEVLTSTNLSLSCRRSTDEKLKKKRVNCLYQSLHKEKIKKTTLLHLLQPVPLACSTSKDLLSRIRTRSRFSASSSSLALDNRVWEAWNNDVDSWGSDIRCKGTLNLKLNTILILIID